MGTKGKGPKQSLISAKDLTIQLPEGGNSSSDIFSKKRKTAFQVTRPTHNSRESRNFKNAITFESTEVSQLIFAWHLAQHHYNTSHITVQCVYITTLGVVQTVHLPQDLSTAVCCHRMLTPHKHGREHNVCAEYNVWGVPRWRLASYIKYYIWYQTPFVY